MLLFFHNKKGIILPIDVHIFQDSWNHQPDYDVGCHWLIMAYPLVIYYIAMENSPFIDGLPINSMVIFYSS